MSVRRLPSTASGLPKVFVALPLMAQGMKRLCESCEVIVYEADSPPSREIVLQNIRGMDGLVVYPFVKIDKEVLDVAGPQLKVVSSHSVGLEHIDLALCKERGVQVGYTPEVLNTAVAEQAVGLTLAAARRFGEASQAVKDGIWGTRWEAGLWLAGKQISGSTVGIVGLGRIGLAIAKRIAAFEPSSLLYTGRNPRPETADPLGAEFVAFDDLLRRSDFVIAACAITESSKGLFNKDAFRKMKYGAVFVNITRGVLVDQEALIEALKSGQVGAAGLDVTTPEPLPTSHPLLALKNCLVIPHLASATRATRSVMCELVVDNLMAGLTGKPLREPAC